MQSRENRQTCKAQLGLLLCEAYQFTYILKSRYSWDSPLVVTVPPKSEKE